MKPTKNKINVYVLTVSKVFPVTHPRKGEYTMFAERIKKGFKLHTIRSNFDLWKKRIDKVNKGEALISLRQWEDKPYKSKQVEIRQFKKGEIGYQYLDFYEDKDGVASIKYPIVDNYSEPNIKSIALNDGLEYKDFESWFKNYNLAEPMIIIHFTEFRY